MICFCIYNTFLIIAVEVKASEPALEIRLVVGYSQGHAFSSTSLLFLSVKFHGDFKTVTVLR